MKLSMSLVALLAGCATPAGTGEKAAARKPPPLAQPQAKLSCPVGSKDVTNAIPSLRIAVESGAVTRARETIAICSAAFAECGGASYGNGGEASIRLAIGADGVVSRAEATSTIPMVSGWQSCVTTIASKLSFDEAAAPSIVVARYRIEAFHCPPGVPLCY